THGASDSLTAVVRSPNRAGPLRRECEVHPSSRRRQRSLRVFTEAQFVSAADAPRILYFPCPPGSRFAWARHAAGSQFALCGVAHTRSVVSAPRPLCYLLPARYESSGSLFCPSGAVADLVRGVTGAFAESLAARFGGVPALRPRLEVIPLAVNPEKFRPP